jgi:membrane-bound serine protease (ClpP class)
LVLSVVIPFALILIVMIRLALRIRTIKVVTGAAGMIGLKGRAETAIAPEGRVLVRGELWRARSQMKIAPEESIRVIGVDGLTLEVEAEKDAAVAPKPASLLDQQ